MAGTTAIIFGNQLYEAHPALESADRVLMVESAARLHKRHWHAKKLVFVLSAMRHYAESLRTRGVKVDYRPAVSFQTGLAAHIKKFRPARVVFVEPAEYDALQATSAWAERFPDIQFDLLPDQIGFTCERRVFARWAQGKKNLLLENFYRWQRKRLNVLMDGDQPVGGRWNFDAENRHRAQDMPKSPKLPRFAPDALTQTVIDTVARDFPDAFGDAEPFSYPVTHADAQKWLDVFFQERLTNFGPFEDAMRVDDPFLFHGVIALLLNIGLLTPQAVISRAEAAYHEGGAPLQSVEGFIRQIIGWREYVHGVYWLYMPEYKTRNYFGHSNPVPDFFWTGETDMRCLADTIRNVRQHAYTHHIPRLMLLANFGNLAGIDPAALTEWFLSVYIDAYDWVMWPNVLGLGLYADGGEMSTKPYVASAAYIKKMSAGYCPQCRYDSSARIGDDACPFNALYWDFLARHQKRLEKNPRMGLIMKGLARRDDMPEIRARADQLVQAWSEGGETKRQP
jgi:deoxyribodipyrimidine photolyase-related protein